MRPSYDEIQMIISVLNEITLQESFWFSSLSDRETKCEIISCCCERADKIIIVHKCTLINVSTLNDYLPDNAVQLSHETPPL